MFALFRLPFLALRLAVVALVLWFAASAVQVGREALADPAGTAERAIGTGNRIADGQPDAEETGLERIVAGAEAVLDAVGRVNDRALELLERDPPRQGQTRG